MINHINTSKNIPKVLFFLLFIFSSYEIFAAEGGPCKDYGDCDEKWGQKVVAHVVPCSTNFESLKRFLKTRLRDYEIPKDLVGVKEIKTDSINWKKKA